MFKKLTPTEAGRLDSVLYSALAKSDAAGNNQVGDDVLDVLTDLRGQHGKYDPDTVDFRLKDA